jgi:tetratricopeptide (TPR) repeat protein
MKKITLIMLLILPILNHAIYIEQGGVRNAALGSCGIASSNDLSASVYNPALLAIVNRAGLLTDSRKYFWDLVNDELSFNYTAIGIPFGRFGYLASSGSFFSSNLLNQNKIGLHYANFLLGNKLTFGVSAYQYQIGYDQNEFTVVDPFFQEYGYDKSVYDFDFGLAYRFSDKLKFGFVGYNLSSADIALAEENEDKIARKFGVGIDYTWGKANIVSDVKYTSSEIETQNGYEFSLGCEYELAKNFDLRAGYDQYSLSSGFGINLLSKEITNTNYDPISSKEILNIRKIEIGIDYMFQFPISGIISKYGDHVIGIRINYKSSSDEIEKLSKFVPPVEKYVTHSEAKDLSDNNVKVDSLLTPVIAVVDTVFVESIIEKVLYDTIVVFSGVPDSTYMQKARELEAMKAENKILRANNKAQWHLLEALKKYYSGDYYDAIDECKRAIQLAPGLAIAYIRLGSIYLKVNEPEKAKFYWKKARRIEPNNPELKRIAKFLE